LVCAGILDTVSHPELQARERILSVRRASISLGIGVVVGGLVAIFGAPELFPLTSWMVATTVVLAWVWGSAGPWATRAPDVWPRRRTGPAPPTPVS
jgi:hypothetical protein